MDYEVFSNFKSSIATNLSKTNDRSLNRLFIGEESHIAFRFKHRSELEKEHPDMEFFDLLELSEERLKNVNKPDYLQLNGDLDQKHHQGEFFDSLDDSHNHSYDIVFNTNFDTLIEPVVDPKSHLPTPLTSLGFLSESIDIDGVDYLIHESSSVLFNKANLLNETGCLVLASVRIYSGDIPGHFIDPISEKILNKEGFYINAILQEEPNYEMRGNRNFVTIVVISRNEMSGSIFVADLTTEVDLASNFFAGIDAQDEDQNLTHGYYMSKRDFYTLEQLRNTDRAEKTIFFNYDGYKQVLFKDLVGINEEDDSEIFDLATMSMGDVTDDSEHDDMTLLAVLREIPKNDKLNTKELAICIEDSWDNLKVSESSDEYDYIYFMVDKSDHAKYLEIFFNSELGRQIYYSNLKFRDNTKRLSTEEIYNFKVLIPEKEELLKNTIRAFDKINELNRSVGSLKYNFLQNPKKSISKDISLLDDMLLAAGALNEEDEILTLIRREEGPDIEFKQTYRLPVIPEGNKLKDGEFDNISNRISAGVIKVINSFINTDGGTLLIGVQDSNHTITGLKDELKHFFGDKYPEMPEQQDRFNMYFKLKLEKAFEKIFVDDNIDYKFVYIEDKWIFRVDCKRSLKPCFIQESAKLSSFINGSFFFRTGSESRPLKDQEMANYLEERFYKLNE